MHFSHLPILYRSSQQNHLHTSLSELRGVSEKQAIKVLRRAFEKGINFVDTFRKYGDSEIKIGKALVDVRHRYYLATKIRDHARKDAQKSLDESLKRLKTDYIDLLFKTILPAKSDKPYDIRIACRYAFALAAGDNGGMDLLSTLPVLLGIRFSIKAGLKMLDQTKDLRDNLAGTIHSWQEKYKPSKTKGMYLFSFSIFSNINENNNANNR